MEPLAVHNVHNPTKEATMPDISALQTAVNENSAALAHVQTAMTGFRQQPEQHIIDELTKAINANTETLKAMKGPPEMPVVPTKPAHKSTFFNP
jgi:hypothetical protein